MPECDFTLREWNLDAVSVQGIIDTFHDDTVGGSLCKHIHPYKNLQRDTAVVEALEQYIDRLLLVSDSQSRNGIDEQGFYFLDVAAVCHAHFQNVQFVAMVLRHVLVVLGEELGVLEGDDRTVERLNQG